MFVVVRAVAPAASLGYPLLCLRRERNHQVGTGGRLGGGEGRHKAMLQNLAVLTGGHVVSKPSG